MTKTSWYKAMLYSNQKKSGSSIIPKIPGEFKIRLITYAAKSGDVLFKLVEMRLRNVYISLKSD